MKRIVILIVLSFVMGSITNGQLYKGPATGSVAGGVKVSTDVFQKVQSIKEPIEKYEKNKVKLEPLPGYLESVPPTKPEGSNFVQDVNLVPGLKKQTTSSAPLILASLQGIPDQGNQIPPDPYIAAGANHVIAVVNTRFRIIDKLGNSIKTIEASNWFRSSITGGTIYDPKVTYDHFAKRWVMVWLHVNETARVANFLVSVSKDSSAVGDWYNYVLPSNMYGSDTTGSWADYQGVGYDSVAVYITANQASFGSSSIDQGSRVRIINKSELYSNTGGKVSWIDFWDLRLPNSLGIQSTGLRPSISYTQSNDYYLLVHSRYTTGTYFTVYKITNPLNNPIMTGYNVNVTTYLSFYNPQQLGGTSPDLEGGGFNLRNEPIFRDGNLYAVHSIAGNGGANARYIKINTTGAAPVTEEDYAFGSQGYYYFYPAISVDKDNNVLLSFSRTSATEYVGAYFTSRLKDDPPGTFSGSWALKPGNSSYQKTFGSTRNRWGDYNGAWLDPTDQNNFWMLTEYVESKDTWGTWIGQVRLIPFAGAMLVPSSLTKNFGNVEKNKLSDTLNLVIKNYGKLDLVITNAVCNSPFKLIKNLTYPVTLKSFDSIAVQVQFQPLKAGIYSDTLKFVCNDSQFKGIPLTAKGFEILQASERVLYASSGKENTGFMAIINRNTGTGTNLGATGLEEVTSLAVHPKTKIIYALSANTVDSKLLRVNAVVGDAYQLYSIPIPNIGSITFDTSGVLYLVNKTGVIYKMDVASGKVDSVTNAKTNLASVAINPWTNEMWGSLNAIFGTKDKIFKINLTTGTATLVGQTGMATVVTALHFDQNSKLYGATGVLNDNDNYISVSATDGVGTVVGNIGLKHITGLAYLPGKLTDVQNSNVNGPKSFSISQNYPNPFNPSTTISYAIPQPGNVKITIYNLLGEVVKTLFEGEKNAGNYQVNWNADNMFGNKVGSGVYFYEVKYSSGNGNNFSDIKKMTLLK